MSSISTLMTRNPHDVFGESDPARRRAAINEIFTEDCVFYQPSGIQRGRDEIDRRGGRVKTTHPEFQYQPIADPEELGNGGRIQWVSGRPGEANSLRRDRFHHRPGRPDCRPLSLLRYAAPSCRQYWDGAHACIVDVMKVRNPPANRRRTSVPPRTAKRPVHLRERVEVARSGASINRRTSHHPPAQLMRPGSRLPRWLGRPSA